MNDFSFDLWFLDTNSLGGLLLPLSVLWFVLAFGAAKLAAENNRGRLRWFVFSLLVTPLVTIPSLLILPPAGRASDHNVPLGTDFAQCPTCGEMVSTRSSYCTHCGEELPDG